MKKVSIGMLPGHISKHGIYIGISICLSVCCLGTIEAEGAAVSSRQVIEQIMRLPVDQQRVLAERYGVDLGLDRLGNDGDGERPRIGQPGEQLEQRYSENSDNEDILLSELLGTDGDISLERYGMRVFEKSESIYAPVDNIPVPTEYIMGPGDSINVTMYGKDQLQEILEVGREGAIQFPRLGAISVVGLSFDQVTKLIETRVKQQFIGTQVIVSMGRLRSINIFMAGEVKRPGTYSVSGFTTLMQVLYVAGGVSDIGSLRNIEVRRNGRVAATFDLYDLMLKGEPKGDIRLLSGDVVFVPAVRGLVKLSGAVKRPAIYEVLGHETLGQLLTMSGGVANDGFLRNARMVRYTSGASAPELIDLDLTDADQLSLVLLDGDEINIDKVFDHPSNPIELKGAVVRPGLYAWQPGIRFSGIVRDLDGHLLSDADRSIGVIVRRKSEQLDIEVISFSPLNSIVNSGSTDDPTLEPFDEILIFNRYRSIFDGEITSNKSIYGVDSSNEKGNGGRDTFFHGRILDSPIAQEDDNQPKFIVESTDSNIPDAPNGKSQDPIADLTSLVAREKVQFGDQRRGWRFNSSSIRYSRKRLLEPIIERLRLQANQNSPVDIVTIAGAVKFPGEYPLLSSRILGDLLELAGGVTDDVYLEKVEIHRIDSKRNVSPRLYSRTVNLREELAGRNDPFILQGRDYVLVNSIPSIETFEYVEVTGELMLPGKYRIAPGETLSSVIERAGGLTDKGFAEGAVFSREAIKLAERQRLIALVDDISKARAEKIFTQEDASANLSPNVQNENDSELIERILDIQVQGRFVIDLPRVLIGDESADIDLQNGDILEVPRFANSISIVGQVRRPGSFRHREDLTIGDYIELAAGTTDRAYKGGTYVLKANGTVTMEMRMINKMLRFESAARRLDPGDTIVVPINQRYASVLSRYREISTAFFQGLTTVALFKRN